MTYGAEKIAPYNSGEKKNIQIERMFDTIAGKYDSLNRLLSLGFDKGWRRKGVEFLRPFSPRRILDVATGTGDLALYMYKKLEAEHITGIDLSEGMMDVGRRKVSEAGYDRHITFEPGDGTSLAYADNTFDAVTAAFGIRNFEDIAKGISEMYRVLKPEGHLMILELSVPEKFPMKQLYTIYSKMIIPFWVRLFSAEKKAYLYLPASIKVVPQGKVMADLLSLTGFGDVCVKTFTCGVCSLYTGKKSKI